MSRYDDPRWYEEPDSSSSPPKFPAYDDLRSYPLYPDSSSQTQGSAPPPSSTPDHSLARTISQIAALAALVIAAFLGGWFSHQFFGGSFAFNTTNDQSQAYAQLFQQAWTTVDQNYVDRKAIDYKKMSYAAITAMVESLQDRGHTRFMTPDQIKSENQQLSGKLIGIGVTLHQDTTTKDLIITSVIPGSPADKAGFKHNDVILTVDGKSLQGQDIGAASSLIQGKAGTAVTLTVRRAGSPEPLSIRAVRAEITVPNVIMNYLPESHTAHIQIVQFADGVSSQLRDAINKAKSQGARSIILDLRDNSGGYLNEAINTTSLFVKSGNVLLEQDSKGRRTAVAVTGNTLDTTDPMVVLVNENSASAAEIVAGALRDNGRATIIGTTTFGTGTVLQQYTLSDGSALLIGIQEWLTPKGAFIRDKGITPDIVNKLGNNVTPLTPGDETSDQMSEQQILQSNDTQLIEAIKYLQKR